MSGRHHRGPKPPKQPKNHFVPIPAHEAGRHRQSRPEPPKHDRLDSALLTGSLALTIEALTPIHVGAGWFDEQGNELVKATIFSAGRPVVPGSSIKGACRQLHEALTSSGDPWSGQGLDAARENGLSALLFGHLGWRGRITFDDAVPTAPVELAVGPVRVPHSPLGGWSPGERDYEGHLKEEPKREDQGRRFYGRLTQGQRERGEAMIQAIPAGTRLATVLRFHNVDAAELGSVLFALGLGTPRFPVKLGGFKNEPLGWARFAVGELTRRRGLGRAIVDDGTALVAEAIEAAGQRFQKDEPWSRVLDKCADHFDPSADLRRLKR